MSKQIVVEPEISKCWCGEEADLIDWDFRFMWRVICKKGHMMTKECATENRAIHRWNNRVSKKIEDDLLLLSSKIVAQGGMF